MKNNEPGQSFICNYSIDYSDFIFLVLYKQTICEESGGKYAPGDFLYESIDIEDGK